MATYVYVKKQLPKWLSCSSIQFIVLALLRWRQSKMCDQLLILISGTGRLIELSYIRSCANEVIDDMHCIELCSDKKYSHSNLILHMFAKNSDDSTPHCSSGPHCNKFLPEKCIAPYMLVGWGAPLDWWQRPQLSIVGRNIMEQYYYSALFGPNNCYAGGQCREAGSGTKWIRRMSLFLRNEQYKACVSLTPLMPRADEQQTTLLRPPLNRQRNVVCVLTKETIQLCVHILLVRLPEKAFKMVCAEVERRTVIHCLFIRMHTNTHTPHLVWAHRSVSHLWLVLNWKISVVLSKWKWKASHCLLLAWSGAWNLHREYWLWYFAVDSLPLRFLLVCPHIYNRVEPMPVHIPTFHNNFRIGVCLFVVSGIWIFIGQRCRFYSFSRFPLLHSLHTCSPQRNINWTLEPAFSKWFRMSCSAKHRERQYIYKPECTHMVYGKYPIFQKHSPEWGNGHVFWMQTDC